MLVVQGRLGRSAGVSVCCSRAIGGMEQQQIMQRKIVSAGNCRCGVFLLSRRVACVSVVKLVLLCSNTAFFV